MKVSKQMLCYGNKSKLTLYCTSFLVTEDEDKDEDRKPPAKCAKMSKLPACNMVDGPAETTGTPTDKKLAAMKHPPLVTDIKKASPANRSVLAPPPITQPPSPYKYKCESTFTQTRISNKQFFFLT
jgi:hypothetical protein